MADASTCDAINWLAVSAAAPSSLPVMPFSTPPSSRRTVLVDSLPAVRDMLRELARVRELAVDCEGVDLDRHGKLCLLALSPDPHRVFLLDVSKLGKAAFTTPSQEPVEAASGGSSTSTSGRRGGGAGNCGGMTVKSLLEDESVRKLLYDVRRDSDALYHQYGVRLQNVLDVQVAELAVSRCCEGQRVYVLTGLGTALDQHLPPHLARQRQLTAVSKAVMSANYKEDCRFWDRRPLSEEALRYASDDVAYLHPLHTALLARIRMRSQKLLTRVLTYSATRTREYDTPYHLLPKGRNRAMAPSF